MGSLAKLKSGAFRTPRKAKSSSFNDELFVMDILNGNVINGGFDNREDAETWLRMVRKDALVRVDNEEV